MSVQNAAAFLNRLETDTDLQAQVQNKADAVRIAAEQNTPFTLEEFQQAADERAASLSPEDLKTVAGGGRAFV